MIPRGKVRLKGVTKMNLFLACLLFFFIQSPQPKLEYGQTSELKGVKKIFIDTGMDLEVRNNMLKTINKELKNVVVTESAEEAEVVLVFGATTSTYYDGTTATASPNYDGGVTATSKPTYKTVTTGEGMVLKLGKEKVRLIMQFGDSRGYIFERRPSTNFARAFVKAYKEANK
jgi:hypothetical protein